MGNPSFGGVLRLLACFGLLLLSTRVVPAFAVSVHVGKTPVASGATHPYQVPQGNRNQRTTQRVAIMAHVGLGATQYHALYLQAVAAIEHYELQTAVGRFEEQSWPFPLPIAVSCHDFSFTTPDYVQHQPSLVLAGKPRPAALTKHTRMLRRYGAGQFT